MAHLLATREALDRFMAELGHAAHGPSADRLQRAAAVTRSLLEDAITTPGAGSPWVDHNLGVVVATGLDDQGAAQAARTLFAGVRRRLSEALGNDPDDLVLGLALARGVAADPHDARLAETMQTVVNAASSAHAGPRLVSAAVRMVVSAARSKVDEVRAAATELASTVRQSVERLGQRLPKHPGLSLDSVELVILSASRAEGQERGTLLGQARGLLSDHEGSFGDSSRARGLRADIIASLARSGGSGADLRREATQLLQAGVADRSLRAKTAERLVRAMERAGGLDNKTATRLSELFEGYLHGLSDGAGGGAKAWRNVFGMLLKNSGDQAGLVAHWERTLQEDPKNAEAAKGLAGRLMRNLRGNLKAPFSSDILDKLLSAVPFGAMARWSADDARLVLDTVEETLGSARAAAFARDRLLEVRELKNKGAVHDRGLELFKSLGDDEATLEFAEKAAKKANHRSSRLWVAETLLDRGERLSEAESILKPLLEVRGKLGKKAQALKQKLSRHPSLRGSHKSTLIGFEEKIGIGTATAHELRVVFIGPNYALAEVYKHKAPEFYEHKHLRTMLRGEDLPKGVTPADLRKGDTLKAPLSGQDSNPKRDKAGLRVYWIADPAALTLTLDSAAIDARWAKEEADFGIGGKGPMALKVGWDGRKESLTVRAFKADGGGREFPIRPVMNTDQLPEGMDAGRLGKGGKRLWGRVEKVEGKGPRSYRVVGTVSSDAPAAPATPAKRDDAKAAEAKATEAKPAEAKATEAKPAEAKATEAKPAEAKATEAKPAEAKATEAKPAQAEAAPAPKPAETKPESPSAAESTPTGGAAS